MFRRILITTLLLMGFSSLVGCVVVPAQETGYYRTYEHTYYSYPIYPRPTRSQPLYHRPSCHDECRHYWYQYR